MRHCSETRDFAPVLFDWYKFVGSLALAFRVSNVAALMQATVMMIGFDMAHP